MNDVAGNMTKNVTNNSTTNNDSGNFTIGSNISKGNTKTQEAKIRGSDWFYVRVLVDPVRL